MTPHLKEIPTNSDFFFLNLLGGRGTKIRLDLTISWAARALGPGPELTLRPRPAAAGPFAMLASVSAVASATAAAGAGRALTSGAPRPPRPPFSLALRLLGGILFLDVVPGVSSAYIPSPRRR